eukprot:6990740-Ditylum_brightwellii.AAC.1
MDLDNQLYKLRTKLSTAKSKLKTLNKEKINFELEKDALCNQIATLTKGGTLSERQAQELSDCNKQMKMMVGALKSELHEICH